MRSVILNALSISFRRLGNRLICAGTRIYQLPAEKRTIPWFDANGDKTLRLTYDLCEDSTVFDLGGYEGQWASDIYAMYRCSIYVFEPVEEFAKKIQKRFERNDNIHVHQIGLSGVGRSTRVYLNRDSTSAFKQTPQCREINLVRADDFLVTHKIDKIDLMKINIEGGEYDLLDHLLETGWIKRIRDIQVQFHDFVPDAEPRMKRIQIGLSRTHTLTYQYPFVWENWRKD